MMKGGKDEMEKKVVCRNCGGAFPPDQGHRTQEGAWVCQQCFLDNLPV